MFQSPFNVIKSFGVVPYFPGRLSESNYPFRFIIYQEPTTGKWSFPKGKKEAFDKNDFATAKREVEEELQLPYDIDVEVIHFDKFYEANENTIKLVRLFLGRVILPTTMDQELEKFCDENRSRVRLVSTEAAHHILSYKEDKRILEDADKILQLRVEEIKKLNKMYD
jgi:8-oxo-dGTP pyrophosphatase MutT (NUDIX family)